MRILLTGATGYIGKRILPVLAKAGHQLICCVRDRAKFTVPLSFCEQIEIVEVDFTKKESLTNIPDNIDAAYYLIHSMSETSDYTELEKISARNFRERMSQTTVQQVIYLGGMGNDKSLSKHLNSRQRVEDELSKGSYALTSLRAGIIIGAGSASFEIIRDLVEKLPLMITPRWLNTACQPISVSDVIQILHKVLLKDAVYNRNFDIAGEQILSYKQMLLGFARQRGLRRWIWTIPLMTPRLSSYWLYFVTSTSYKLAVALVDSMKVEVVARDREICDILQIKTKSFEESIGDAFRKIKQNEIVSSWKDSTISGRLDYRISDFVNVPVFGCFTDHRKQKLLNSEKSLQRIWEIGGETGWYYANFLWRIRGFMDKLLGGVGLRRGRTSKDKINAGDTLDFWRVLYANKEERRLLLFAEMKLPGEAWLEFHIKKDSLHLTASFRPKGLWGRLYWYLILPFHGLVFRGMLRGISE